MENQKMDLSYKQFHEEFMQNNNGTTLEESILFVLPAPIAIFVARSMILGLSSLGAKTLPTFSSFIIEYIIMVVPLTLCFTILSHMASLILFITTLMCFLFLTINYVIVMRRTYRIEFFQTLLSIDITGQKRSFITNFRATVNFIAAICILAVDFKIFPRRFAKTENYGYGLMDTGVGLFCLANAIVTPEATGRKKSQTPLIDVANAFKSSIPLILLGTARFFTTQQIDYQVHTSEYGVHWNFFITLAVVKIICTILLTMVDANHSLLISIVVIAIHELILGCGISEWVLGNSTRDTFVSANREGIISSIGYVALFFAGIAIGQLIQQKRQTLRDYLFLETRLSILAIVLWICTHWSSQFFGVSRRLANTGYFLWVLAYCITMLVLLLMVELMLYAISTCRTFIQKKKQQGSIVNESGTPIILDAISYNGLFFFLVANVCTGAVNICIQTLRQTNTTSIVIINLYMLVVCFVTVVLYRKGIKLKVW